MSLHPPLAKPERLAQGSGSPAGTIVLESEALGNVTAGWKARETYQLVSPDEFVETFEVASSSGAYEVYGRARFKRGGRP